MTTSDDVRAALGRIRDTIYLSPCAYSETYSRATGLRIHFKLENLQMTGSFKERGALNKLLLLSDDERARGVIAASAGNHAQGVAFNATRLGVPSTIVMPESTPLIKVASTATTGPRSCCMAPTSTKPATRHASAPMSVASRSYIRSTTMPSLRGRAPSA